MSDIDPRHLRSFRAVVRRVPRAAVLSAGHRPADRPERSLVGLAGEPVLRPVVPLVADCLLEVSRGRGTWFAPRPLETLMPTPHVRWIPITDAEGFDLALVWTDRAPEALITRLIEEVRAITGYEHEVDEA